MAGEADQSRDKANQTYDDGDEAHFDCHTVSIGWTDVPTIVLYVLDGYLVVRINSL